MSSNTEPQVDLPEALFEPIDPGDDGLFYSVPRMVTHIDDATIEMLTRYYAEVLPREGALLDLMSSCVSHLPPDREWPRIVGLGMNAAELAANPRLSERVVQDLNQHPELPFATGSFAAVMIVVSVQYLTRPVAVFREIARVLQPGGRLIVAMSHRCFPTKAVRAFRELDAVERVRLVGAYCTLAGGFLEPAFVDRSPWQADPLWIVTALRDA
ncbi:MAG: class I SAM-dependent methyltransferase [Gammaproteobacteria bacterium]